MATTFINPDAMLAGLKTNMNAEMMAAAEPVIRKAVEEAEREMRKRLAAMFVSLIDKSFSLERQQDTLLIRVEHRKDGP